MNAHGCLHGRLVHARRTAVLGALLAPHLPAGATVADVGCGDGRLAAIIRALRPDVSIRGFDVIARPDAHMPVEIFDGRKLPCPDADVDVVMLVDVLHHVDEPELLLAEAARVAGKSVLVKDHVLAGPLAGPTLRFMDWVGNAAHGVSLPYNYWTQAEWNAALERLGLEPRLWSRDIRLYPWPASLLFGRSLHVLALLTARSQHAAR